MLLYPYIHIPVCVILFDFILFFGADMADQISVFQEAEPSLESYWRSVILFGRNVASYKFALAKSLLEIVPTGRTEVSLEELAEPFSRHLCEHIAHSPKQVTSSRSSFLDACRAFNEGTASREELLEITAKKGFVNVIDAFHIVNNGELPVSFYRKDFFARTKKIILTDEIYKLQDLECFEDFGKEAESRWRLVETAWEQKIAANLLEVKYSELGELLYVDSGRFRRKAVTSARGALNGYQKGKCFYCHRDILIGDADMALAYAFGREFESSYVLEESEPRLVSDGFSRGGRDGMQNGIIMNGGTPPSSLVSLDGRPLTRENALYRLDSSRPADDAADTGKCAGDGCDVDHFFAHTLQPHITDVNRDGVWNLVLTCTSCNRGEGGKSAKVPAIRYLDRLHERNEFLISSHHPLRETLMMQTGRTVEDRIRFLKEMDKFAVNLLIHRWETKEF
jgi:hypothetical protein